MNPFKNLFIAFITGTSLIPVAALADTPSNIALTHIRIIDGTGNTPVEDATILFRNDKIIALGKNIKLPSDTKIMDRTGDTALPGLISDHSHIGLMKETETGPQLYTKSNIEQALAQYRRYGVTTVNALGLNKPELFNKLRQEAHKGNLPVDLYGVDKGIGVPDGAPPLNVGSDQIFRPATPQEARKDVDEMAAEGTDLVKIWVDTFYGSVPNKMSPDVIKSVINEAHKKHLRVAAHIHDLSDAQEVINDGADIIAHGVRDQVIPGEIIQKMKDRKIWYIPTLELDESATAWAEKQPWTTQAFYKAGLSDAFVRQINDPTWIEQHRQGHDAENARKSLTINIKNLQLAYQAGVQIGFGTDSGALPTRIPGVAEQRELALYKEAGLPPLAIIHAATENAARLLKLNDRGVLAPGKKADLMIVKGNPVSNFEDINKVVEVWHSGSNISGPVTVP